MTSHANLRTLLIAAALTSGLVLVPISVITAQEGDASDYCESVGGQVQERVAMWGTNNDATTWVDLGRTPETCRFEADDGSRIHVGVLTLYSESPSLAAAAYLARLPLPDQLPPGNPASYGCTALGGSSQFGTGTAGGGWVSMDDPVDIIVSLCVFPDGSAIDEWGITYYADGTIRGADLAPLFRSDVGDYPPIFGPTGDG